MSGSALASTMHRRRSVKMAKQLQLNSICIVHQKKQLRILSHAVLRVSWPSLMPNRSLTQQCCMQKYY